MVIDRLHNKLEEDKSKMFETAVKRNNELLDRIDKASNDNKYLLKQLQQKENIIKDIKAQLDYLETYSSKEDVFEDMKRRLNRIEKIIKENKNE